MHWLSSLWIVLGCTQIGVQCFDLDFVRSLSSSPLGRYLYKDNTKPPTYGIMVTHSTKSNLTKYQCFRYYDTKTEMNNAVGQFYPMTDAIKFGACMISSKPDLAQAAIDNHILIVAGKHDDCSTKSQSSRARNYARQKPKGILFVENGDLAPRAISSKKTKFIQGHISQELADELRLEVKDLTVSFYSEKREVEGNVWVRMILLMISITIVGVAAIWSGRVRHHKLMKEYSDHLYNSEGFLDFPSQSKDSGGIMRSSIDISVTMTLAILALLSVMSLVELTVDMFFPEAVTMMTTLIFFLLSIAAIYICFTPLINILPPRNRHGGGMRTGVSIFQICLGIITVLVPAIYFSFHFWLHTWIVMDILCILITIMIIRTIRISNAMFITSLFITLFLIHLIAFFYNSYESLNEEKVVQSLPAIGSGITLKDRIPNRLYAPESLPDATTVCNIPPPYTDIEMKFMVLPGILIAFCYSFDLKSAQSSSTLVVPYFLTSYIGFASSMVIYQIAGLITQVEQYALLYILPFTLVPVLLLALIRIEFVDFWKDSYKI